MPAVHFSAAKKGGYDADEVDQYLATVDRERAQLQRQIEHLEQEIANLREPAAIRDAIGVAMSDAQAYAQQIRERADRQAERIIQEAKAQAEAEAAAILHEAQVQLVALRDKINERTNYLSNFDALLQNRYDSVRALAQRVLEATEIPGGLEAMFMPVPPPPEMDDPYMAYEPPQPVDLGPEPDESSDFLDVLDEMEGAGDDGVNVNIPPHVLADIGVRTDDGLYTDYEAAGMEPVENGHAEAAIDLEEESVAADSAASSIHND